ncbi:hypothetical protein CALCODRAFT_33975 [Calocera cornea HHB12733]|uniref:Uncharacterized protein n=1 Tax=Calocera cornea HHB12733 TaxID=1353952 RepID=A0A165E106_9BASI|nr:hypothetical protein CALCODRAFT_33975 [Calocera cornea HHB12733]
MVPLSLRPQPRWTDNIMSGNTKRPALTPSIEMSSLDNPDKKYLFPLTVCRDDKAFDLALTKTFKYLGDPLVIYTIEGKVLPRDIFPKFVKKNAEFLVGPQFFEFKIAYSRETTKFNTCKDHGHTKLQVFVEDYAREMLKTMDDVVLRNSKGDILDLDQTVGAAGVLPGERLICTWPATDVQMASLPGSSLYGPGRMK